MYNALREAMKEFEDELHPALITIIGKLQMNSDFRIKDTLLDNIIALIGEDCSWCKTSTTDSVLQTLKNKVYSEVNENTLRKNEIEKARSKLEDAYDPHLVDTLDALKNSYPSDDQEEYDWLISNVTTHLSSGNQLQDEALEFTREAITFLQSLNNFAWDVKCQAQFPKVIAEYETNHIVIKGILEEVNAYLDSTWDSIEDDRLSYIAETMSLQSVGNAIKFAEVTSTVNGKKVRLDSSLNDRLLAVEELRNQMDSMNYVFSMLVSNSKMQSTSGYWQVALSVISTSRPACCLFVEICNYIAKFPLPRQDHCERS
jgi:hypothetical protein